MKKQSLWMVILLVIVCAVGCQRYLITELSRFFRAEYSVRAELF